MNLFRSLESFSQSLRGGALSIGNFDGVHQGHARIIEALKNHASHLNGPAIIFTFDPHPVRLLRPEQTPPPLTWTNRKATLLSELGIDAVVAYPTNREFLNLDYQQFFDQIIVNALGAKALIEGPNFYFGRNREGTIETLGQLCTKSDIRLEIIEPLCDSDEFVSSSRIRKMIKTGCVGKARQMLTRPYRLRGMVTHGASRGAKIGFPTANLDAIDTLIPGHGVYGGQAIVSGQLHRCAIHIGPNPTFGEKAHKVEVHLLNFSDSIYGLPMEVDFVERLRDIRQFESVEALKKQLAEDVESVRQLKFN